MTDPKICLIILSHSSYTDIWELTLESYAQNYLNEQPIPAFITSDGLLSLPIKGLLKKYDFNHLNYPPGSQWGADLKLTLKNRVLDEFDYVIFSFDDLIIKKAVPNVILSELVQKMQRKGLRYLKLVNTYNPLKAVFSANGSGTYEIDRKDSYRGSLVFSIWELSEIRELVAQKGFEEFSAWEYERKMNHLIGERRGYHCVNRSLIHYSNAIIKGRLNPMVLRRCEHQLGMEYRGVRETMNLPVLVMYRNKVFLYRLFRLILPNQVFSWIRRIKARLNLNFIALGAI